MDIVDVFSASDYVALDGSWLRSKSFNLAYHPDMSLRTFGLTTRAKGSVVPSARGNRSERAEGVKPFVQPRTPTDLLQEPVEPLELSKSTSDYELLAAARAQATDANLIEQRKRLRGAPEASS
jgi:hypothetical protein